MQEQHVSVAVSKLFFSNQVNELSFMPECVLLLRCQSFF